MSDFSNIWQNAGPVLTTVFGVRLRIVPQKSGPYVAGGPDPDRPEFTVVGIIDERTLFERAEGRGSRDADQPTRTLDRCAIDFEIRAFTSPAQWPKPGDRIFNTESADGAQYEVVAPDPSGQGRVSFKCVRVFT